ncbi:hypothetical protein Scep_006681 [Stephania cephalantha]|uniref:Gcp-like domain-containing protein n=1 Tax=Stephania cephalantha TaxID=152367 RepID=A0AAP0PMG5_9MAGN
MCSSLQVVQRALDEAKLTETDLSAVAVTIGPGLSLCLRGNLATKIITVLPSSFGVQKARKIAGRFCLPIVGIHHMEAHALVASDGRVPDATLISSQPGGHNLLILASDLGHYVQLGTTIDDAIGEAYDKIARWLGLDMRRGGPALEELAREGNEESIKFRVPMKQHKDCNFSYAGLKTQIGFSDPDVPISSASCQDRTIRADIAASFQRVAVMHLEERCERAIEWALQIEPSIKSLVVSGGVASNQYLRIRLNQIVEQNGLRLVCPPPRLCTDNGVMIAWTGIEHFTRGRYDPPPPADEPDDALLDLRPRWPLGEEHVEGRSHARSLRKARMHPSLTSMIQENCEKLSRNQIINILLEAAFIIHHVGLYNIPEKHSSEQTRTYVVNIIRNSSRMQYASLTTVLCILGRISSWPEPFPIPMHNTCILKSEVGMKSVGSVCPINIAQLRFKICIGYLFLLSSSLFMSVLKLGLPCLPNPHPLM